MTRLAAAASLLIVLLACSLTTPETPPLVITATPQATLTPSATATIVPQLATRPPTATPTPTPVPCTPRDDWFAYTVSPGDTLAGIALRAGTSVDALSLANCIEPDTLLLPDQGVRVPIALLPPSAPADNLGCAEQWFFIFRTGESEITASCPDPVIVVEALGQDFEGGRMLRYPPIPGALETNATIYVIYNNGFWQSFPDMWEASQPANDPAISPPRHRIQPSEGFGKIWRENPAVRTGLGWAYTPPTLFMGRIQFATGQTDYWYLDYGTARLAIRLMRSSVAPHPWEIVGEY